MGRFSPSQRSDTRGKYIGTAPQVLAAT